MTKNFTTLALILAAAFLSGCASNRQLGPNDTGPQPVDSVILDAPRDSIFDRGITTDPRL